MSESRASPSTHTPRGATGATMSTKLRPFYSRAQPGLLLCFHYDCVERVRLPRQSRRVLLQQKKTTMAARRGSRRARRSARSGRRREQAGGWYRRAPGRGVAVAAVVMHSSLVCVIQVWHATAEHPEGEGDSNQLRGGGCGGGPRVLRWSPRLGRKSGRARLRAREERHGRVKTGE